MYIKKLKKKMSNRNERYFRNFMLEKMKANPPYIRKNIAKRKGFGLKLLPNRLSINANRLWPSFFGKKILGLNPNQLRSFIIDYKVSLLHSQLDKSSNWLESEFLLPNWLSMLLNRLFIENFLSVCAYYFSTLKAT